MASVGTITLDSTGTVRPRVTDDNGFSKSIELDTPEINTAVEAVRVACVTELARLGLVVVLESRDEKLARERVRR